MSDLIELQKNYILSSLNSIQTDHGIKFLVIDNVVDSIFDFIFPDRNELLRHVAALDKIDSRTRVGQPSVDVIYFLSPTKFNINCIDADFTNVPPKYKKHHIRFLPGYTDDMSRFLKSRSYLPQFMVSLDEIKCGFIPKEHQYFETIGVDQSLQIFFNRQCADLIERNIRRAVSSLLNVCILTGEYPIIRYSEPNPEVLSISRPTILAKKLAFEFQAALDDYARQNKDFPPPNPRQRSICIITDRSLDLFSPLVHPFTYQAMAYDLVKDVDVVTDVYTYEAENEQGTLEKKSSKLRDILDPDWVELKHQHIADVSEYLTAKINDMIAKNPLLVDRSKVKTTTDLLSVVAHLKDFDEDRRRITLHRLLIDRCLAIAKSRNLIELSEMEQNLSGYGHDIEGNKVKHLTEDFIYMLADPHPSITDRIRYIIQYALLKGGLIEEDLVKLLSFIGVDTGHSFFKHFMQLFRNFECLGFLLIKPNLKEGPFKKEWTHSTIMNDPNIYQTSRFIPSVGNLLVNVINNPLLLSESFFPYVKDKPIELLDPSVKPKLLNTTTSATSLRNPRHKAAWAKTNVQSKKPRQRFFYYILGGITHIELKAAYTQSQLKNKDVFIGSDNVITPLQFLQSVERLSENRDHLKLADDVRPLFYAPEFLLPTRLPPVGPPPQLQSPMDEKRVTDIAQQQPHHQADYGDAGSTSEKEGEKDKRRHKFTKFLRR